MEKIITRREALIGGTALGGLTLLNALRPKSAYANLSPYVYKPGYYDVIPTAHLDGTVTLKMKVWCMTDLDGNNKKPKNGMVIYCHSMFWNHKNPCDDVIAKARIKNGWLIFDYDNPVVWGDGFRDRYWFIDKKRCNPNTPEWWVCIPQERNPFYRFDSEGNPAVELIYWQNLEITTVPRWEPIDKVGPGCQP